MRLGEGEGEEEEEEEGFGLGCLCVREIGGLWVRPEFGFRFLRVWK